MCTFEKRKFFQNTNFEEYQLNNYKIQDSDNANVQKEKDEQFYTLVMAIFRNVQSVEKS